MSDEHDHRQPHNKERQEGTTDSSLPDSDKGDDDGDLVDDRDDDGETNNGHDSGGCESQIPKADGIGKGRPTARTEEEPADPPRPKKKPVTPFAVVPTDDTAANNIDTANIRDAVLVACGDDVIRAVDYCKDNSGGFAELRAVRVRVEAIAPGCWTDETVTATVKWLASPSGSGTLEMGASVRTHGKCKLSRRFLERRKVERAAKVQAAMRERAEMEEKEGSRGGEEGEAECEICGQSAGGRPTLAFPGDGAAAVCVHEICATDGSWTVVHRMPQLRALSVGEVRERYGKILPGGVLDDMLRKVRIATTRGGLGRSERKEEGITQYCFASEFESCLRDFLKGRQPGGCPRAPAASEKRRLQHRQRPKHAKSSKATTASTGIHLLAQPDDRASLSETYCIIRENVEVFAATEADVEATGTGRKKPIAVGQVGLRCVHCRLAGPTGRAKRAVCYPVSLERIYRTVVDMNLKHFGACPHVPESVKVRLAELKASGDRSAWNTVRYFGETAQKMGMVDGPGESGVFFCASPPKTSGRKRKRKAGETSATSDVVAPDPRRIITLADGSVLPAPPNPYGGTDTTTTYQFYYARPSPALSEAYRARHAAEAEAQLQEAKLEEARAAHRAAAERFAGTIRDARALELVEPNCAWNGMFARLVRYRMENGGSLAGLPTEGAVELRELNLWVQEQRNNRRVMERAMPHRFSALKEIGFEFDLEEEEVERIETV